MPDVLEQLLITKAHRVAEHVLARLRAVKEPVPYLDYLSAMKRYGFDAELAKDTFFELGYKVTPYFNVDFPTEAE